jgi:hypothetical protein
MSHQPNGQTKQSSEATLGQAQQFLTRLTGVGNNFLRLLPLFLALMLIGGICYLPALIHQASQSVDDDRSLLWMTRILTDTAGSLALEVIYPEEVRLKPADESGQPVSIWLRRATPGFSPSPASLPSITPTLPVKGTPVPTPATNPYLLLIEPYDGSLVFTNKEGLPAAPRVALTSAMHAVTPSTLYVRRAPGEVPTSVPITLSLYAPDGRLITDTLGFSIYTEKKSKAWWRSIEDRLFGPATPLVGMAAALAAFAVEEYRGARQRQLEQEAEIREVQHKREQVKKACLIKIEHLRLLASQDPAKAAQTYHEYRQKTEIEDDWKDPDVAARLEDVWQEIRSSPWQPPLLERASEHFAKASFHDAQYLVNLVGELDSNYSPAWTLATVIDFALAEDRDTWLEEHGPTQIIASLQGMDRDYGNMARGTLIREPVADLLGHLIRAEHVGEIERQLGATEHGLDLLREPECKQKLRQLADDENVSSEARAAAERLLARCRESVRWMAPWPPTRPDILPAWKSWLDLAELAFNPFGPEVAELDPLLPGFALDIAFERIRGARPVMVLGEPGSGRTAAALLLMHNCNDPPESPYESGAFPIYCPLRLDVSFQSDRSIYLETLAQASARAIIRFLAIKPNGFLELAPSRQEQLAELLVICAGSGERLARRLRQASTGTVSGRLLRALGLLDAGARTAGDLSEQAWLDLLSGALPAEFSHLYALVDVAGMPGDEASAAAARLRPLLELSAPLAAIGVHLKLFVPKALEPYLGDLNGFDTVTLSWNGQDLRCVLRERIRRANDPHATTGRDSLEALCDLGARGMGVDELVISAAATPRELVRLGNRLLEVHVKRAPDEAQLSVDDIQAWQKELNLQQ